MFKSCYWCSSTTGGSRAYRCKLHNMCSCLAVFKDDVMVRFFLHFRFFLPNSYQNCFGKNQGCGLTQRGLPRVSFFFLVSFFVLPRTWCSWPDFQEINFLGVGKSSWSCGAASALVAVAEEAMDAEKLFIAACPTSLGFSRFRIFVFELITIGWNKANSNIRSYSSKHMGKAWPKHHLRLHLVEIYKEKGYCDSFPCEKAPVLQKVSGPNTCRAI